jgi:hypothetical protein
VTASAKPNRVSAFIVSCLSNHSEATAPLSGHVDFAATHWDIFWDVIWEVLGDTIVLVNRVFTFAIVAAILAPRSHDERHVNFIGVSG